MYVRLLRIWNFLLRKKISIGANTSIAVFARLTTNPGTSITIGERCIVGHGSLLIALNGKMEIGNDVSINPYCVIYSIGNLKIGDNCRIATGTIIVPANHIYTDPDQPIRCQGTSKLGITIEEDVWIGASVKILDGVTIGKGSVIGAGSVVTKSIPPYSVAVGSPARVVKSRKLA